MGIVSVFNMDYCGAWSGWLGMVLNRLDYCIVVKNSMTRPKEDSVTFQILSNNSIFTDLLYEERAKQSI